jgi:hypothetical protein
MKLIENFHITDKDRGIVEADHDLLIVRSGTIENCRVGGDIRRCGEVRIENVRIKPGPLQAVKYAYGFRFGYSGKPEDGNDLVTIDGLVVEKMGEPSSDYSNFNRDCIAAELGNRLVLIKNSRFEGATDACLDMKSSFAVTKSYFGPAHRQVRIWPGATGYVWECGFADNPGHSRFWTGDDAEKGVLKEEPFPHAFFEATEPEPEPPPEQRRGVNIISGYYRVVLDGKEISQHREPKEAYQSAINAKLANPGKLVTFNFDGGRVEML